LVGEGNFKVGGGILNGNTFILGLKLVCFFSDSADFRVSSQPDLNGSWTAFGGVAKGTTVTPSNSLFHPKTQQDQRSIYTKGKRSKGGGASGRK
jgi:hypothetical protein